MNPTHARRIETMLRSMIEVIAPALDANQLARDQAQILIGNLKLLADQATHTYEYEMVELREFTATLRNMVTAGDGGAVTRTATQRGAELLERLAPVAALDIPREAQLAEWVRDARQAVDDLVAASSVDGSKSFRDVVVGAVLDQAAAQNLRERAWFRATGMDPAPASLPGIEDVLALEAPAPGSALRPSR